MSVRKKVLKHSLRVIKLRDSSDGRTEAVFRKLFRESDSGGGFLTGAGFEHLQIWFVWETDVIQKFGLRVFDSMSLVFLVTLFSNCSSAIQAFLRNTTAWLARDGITDFSRPVDWV